MKTDTTFVIITQGRKNMTLFLVNRAKIKDRWWSYDCFDAIKFFNLESAKTQAKKLRFKNPEVISFNTAKVLSSRNEQLYDYDALEHPFSSEALGQE